MYKWVIKRYKEDPIKVSENVGRQALAAWEAGTPVIKLPNNINITSSSISAIEETYEIQEDEDVLKLLSGIKKKEVITDFEGNVLTNWYKRNVGNTGWEKHYAALPFYYKLVDDDNNTWVAMRLPTYTNDLSQPKELVACTERECKLLDEISHG